MKKILFPTDFSPAAENAFVYALRLAKRTNATVTTFHSYQLPSLEKTHLPVTIQEVYESINLEEFENYNDSIPRLRQIAEEQGLTDVVVNHVMEEGAPKESIIRLAKREEVDLIVMGTTGASGFKEIFLGSVAAEVMENAPCPVLAVPKEAKFDGRIDRVGFMTEFKGEEKKALKWLSDWLAPFEADIYCLHVDQAHIEPLAHRMDNLKLDFLNQRHIHFDVVDATNFEDAVTGYLTEHRIDMLAMVIHKRNFLQELFNYSMTKKMAYHLKTPIMAMQAGMFAMGRKKINPPLLST